jgi:hypothetical protein
MMMSPLRERKLVERIPLAGDPDHVHTGRHRGGKRLRVRLVVDEKDDGFCSLRTHKS